MTNYYINFKMFTQCADECTKCIEAIFITGVLYDNIRSKTNQLIK